ncbi:Bifunctional NAD(P)H-hydrate repair enzyme Nnr [Neolewinella maritima]|uniref:Bifunctional NAD(P)H-hydrate repair enzyme n=1 Tax=Neolewinella maritima TaxID=1383882 RepID=A0ABM9AZ84_9BACT|nr:NAD(P)H-hydrate dehydratase [Neolewinella maritima]CAH1000020.1 Bifunctional NAD(P)H-hydrate repair enzyme Nnr [Neolewinella maritima]
MKVLAAEQHRELDAATLQEQGISSKQLMERAATACFDALCRHFPATSRPFTVVVGSGNNGGDGLAIARLLHVAAYTVRVVLVDVAPASADNEANRQRAREVGVPLIPWAAGEPLPTIERGCVLIDALFGTGLSRLISGPLAALIDHLNAQDVTRVAIDLPSGLYADRPAAGSIIRAERTLSLGYPKAALFAAANASYLGKWELIPFSLSAPYVDAAEVNHHMLTADMVAAYLRKREGSDHKGTFGHALLVAGAYGKMGAAVISARSVLRAGAGLVTTHVPRAGYEIMQISFPEAMCSVDVHKYHFTSVDAPSRYDVVGIGPGLGTDEATAKGLDRLLKEYARPMVVDADALNLIAERGWIDRLPRGSILTPHPKEFERLFGPTADDFARWELQRDRAMTLGVIVLCKTNHTSIATPDGRLYFNTTGNPGMGTGGTGDALTGILTGLLAQGYSSEQAAQLGVYLHGLAGDLAAVALEQESLLAEDVVRYLGKAFGHLHRRKT